MIKIVSVVGIVVLVFFYFLTKESKLMIKSVKETDINTTPTSIVNTITLSHNNRTYNLIYEPLTNRTITLIPNFVEKRSASTIAEEHSCSIASSGGFYTPEDKPLGLFKTNGQILGKRVNNSSLVTGFVYITDEGELFIDSDADNIHPTILQSGPLFTSNKPFPTKRDEYARRNLIIEDIHGQEYIASIFGSENTYNGPMLTDLPDILFSITSPFRVQRALNLDGGSASFFQTSNGFILSEIVAVGSVFCIN